MQNSISGKVSSISHFKNKRVKIKSKLSGRSLDICSQDGNGNSKGDIILYDFYGGDNQKFLIIEQGQNIILKNQSSGKVIQVENESHKNGAKVIAGNNKNSSNQKFRFQQTNPDKNEYFIYCCHSGRVLDVCEENGKNNSKVIQWQFHGKDNQIWSIKEI